MRISTKGRYGVRLMIELGMNYARNVMPLKEIATNQAISEKYLEQIVNQLHKAGLVKSIRGSQGGYTLARTPKEISLEQILRVLEGTLAPVSCLEYDEEGCERANVCASLGVWKELNEAIYSVINRYSLQDLVDQQRALGQDIVACI